jgi:hypothetical protein
MGLCCVWDAMARSLSKVADWTGELDTTYLFSRSHDSLRRCFFLLIPPEGGVFLDVIVCDDPRYHTMSFLLYHLSITKVSLNFESINIGDEYSGEIREVTTCIH